MRRQALIYFLESFLRSRVNNEKRSSRMRVKTSAPWSKSQALMITGMPIGAGFSRSQGHTLSAIHEATSSTSRRKCTRFWASRSFLPRSASLSNSVCQSWPMSSRRFWTMNSSRLQTSMRILWHFWSTACLGASIVQNPNEISAMMWTWVIKYMEARSKILFITHEATRGNCTNTIRNTGRNTQRRFK